MRKLELSSAERRRIARLYVIEGLSTVELAARLRVSEASARRRLRAAGIQARPAAKRSRLRRCDQALLWSDIIDFGVTQTAQRRGVTRRTLQMYIARLRKGGRW